MFNEQATLLSTSTLSILLHSFSLSIDPFYSIWFESPSSPLPPPIFDLMHGDVRTNRSDCHTEMNLTPRRFFDNRIESAVSETAGVKLFAELGHGGNFVPSIDTKLTVRVCVFFYGRFYGRHNRTLRLVIIKLCVCVPRFSSKNLMTPSFVNIIIIVRSCSCRRVSHIPPPPSPTHIYIYIVQFLEK